jgi:hypothetical protein
VDVGHAVPEDGIAAELAVGRLCHNQPHERGAIRGGYATRGNSSTRGGGSGKHRWQQRNKRQRRRRLRGAGDGEQDKGR